MRSKIFALTLILSANTWAGRSTKKDAGFPKILYFPNNAKEWVYINVGANQGYRSDEVLSCYRQLRGEETIWIETGKIKITQAGENASLAKITEQKSEPSEVSFGSFGQIMAGDVISVASMAITRKQTLLPMYEFNYFDLFVDPKAAPYSMELTVAGKERLREAAMQFANKAFGKLLIKGFTDTLGIESENQVESLQRAEAIRQYLIEELGFNDDRVIAIGMGESDIKDDSKVSGFHERNRRIVLKILDR